MRTANACLLLLLSTLITACRSDAPSALPRTAKACYERALGAFSADSVGLGEQLLNEAISRAHAEGDLHTLYLSQLRLAESLSWGNTEGALDMSKQALATYERHPDSERNHVIILDYIGTYASQLAYNNDTSFDEALAYTHRAHALAVTLRDTLGTELLCQTLTSLANIHWAMEEYSEALRFARQAEACAPEHILQGTLQVLGRCLMSCDSLAEAEAVYRRMRPGDDLQAAYIVHSNLAKLALRRRDTEAAEEAIDEAFSHAEDLYFKALEQKGAYYQASLAQERENERLRYASALHRRTLWGAFAVGCLLALAAFFVVRARLRVLRQQRLAEAWRRKHEVDERIHEVRLRRHESRLHAQELQLREQESAAQREQLRQRDGTVAFLKDFILQRSEVIQKLEGSRQRHVALSQREWAEVEHTLDAIDGDRIARLRQQYPAMREEDIQLCILTRLRLTNRAIGNIYGVSISAVQHRKLKLKKEVFGQDDPDIPFEQVIGEEFLKCQAAKPSGKVLEVASGSPKGDA